MTATADFSKLMPGFDFLQGLMKSASTGMPGMSQWIAPTLDPEELEKRIGELRTVQFWLEQNARMLSATIQALEVQRLTLSTLKTMNLPLADISESLRIKLPEPSAAPAPAPAPAAATPAAAPAAPAAVGGADPMAWWGTLTQQFTELAAKAMKEGSAEAAKNITNAALKPASDSTGQALKSAVQASAKAAARKAAPRKSPPLARRG